MNSFHAVYISGGNRVGVALGQGAVSVAANGDVPTFVVEPPICSPESGEPHVLPGRYRLEGVSEDHALYIRCD